MSGVADVFPQLAGGAARAAEPDDRFWSRARAAFAVMPWHEAEYGAIEGSEEFIVSGLAGLRERLP